MRCISIAGWWSSTIEAVHDDVVALAHPAWLSREARREHVRVPTEYQILVQAADRDTWCSGQLQDLSLGGSPR